MKTPALFSPPLLACVNNPAKPGCKRNISIGIFFDGTNNNKKRDQEDIANPLERSHTNMGIRAIRWLLQSLCLCGLLLLGACEAKPPKEETYPSSIVGYNLTHEGIQEFYVNGAWGGKKGSYVGGGSIVCCVTLPMKWRPGLDAEVEWRIGDYIKDGRSMTAQERDAIPSYEELSSKHWVERRLKRRVPIEPYEPEGGRVYVVFLPNDEVKIYVANKDLSHPEHPGYALWEQSQRDPKRLQHEGSLNRLYRGERGAY